jgi:hypothetical protein
MRTVMMALVSGATTDRLRLGIRIRRRFLQVGPARRRRPCCRRRCPGPRR